MFMMATVRQDLLAILSGPVKENAAPLVILRDRRGTNLDSIAMESLLANYLDNLLFIGDGFYYTRITALRGSKEKIDSIKEVIKHTKMYSTHKDKFGKQVRGLKPIGVLLNGEVPAETVGYNLVINLYIKKQISLCIFREEPYFPILTESGIN